MRCTPTSTELAVRIAPLESPHSQAAHRGLAISQKFVDFIKKE